MDFVTTPMDFDQMLTKLDDGEYQCAQDFLDDIDLIADNAIKYNSDLEYETNKVICHRARALQDFAYALVKKEMDTDFEDNCKEIVQRRKKLTDKLKEPQESKAFDPKTNQIVKASTSYASDRTAKPRRKPRRRSRWSSGFLNSRKKPKPKEEDDQEGNESHNEDHESDSEDEAAHNDSKSFSVS